MNAEREPWFRELEPPAGGVERLQRCLEEADRPAGFLPERVAIVGAGVVVLALAIALVAGLRSANDANRPALADVYQAAPFDRLLGRPLQRTDLTVTIADQVVPVSRLDGSNPKVRIYRVD